MHVVAEHRPSELDAFVERIVIAPTPRAVRIAAPGGLQLAASVFEPTGGDASIGVVIVNSATGVRRRYYDAFAYFLSERGFTVVTYDYRGIGGSRPAKLRGFRARMRQWGELDFAAVLDWVRAELGCAAPLVVGHSAGGQIVGLAANNERIGGLLLVAAQSGDFRLWPSSDRLKMAALWYAVVPAMTAAWGYLPGALMGGEDLPAGVATEWAAWGRRRGYLAGGVDASRLAGFARLRVPLLSYSFSDDRIAPPRAVDALLKLYAGADIATRHVRPSELGRTSFGHFGFFRRGVGAALWGEAATWLEARARVHESPRADATASGSVVAS